MSNNRKGKYVKKLKMKNTQLAVCMLAVLLVSACSKPQDKVENKVSSQDNITKVAKPEPLQAHFSWFTYEGNDPIYNGIELKDNQFLNPILSGFYPDPGATQVGNDYYIVNSTFTYYPGLPVFHSTDLVNWTQIGNALDRPDMMDFDGLGMSRGIFAPTIKENNGTFYLATTCVDCGGNFVLTAKNPAGPWSDPIWLPEVGGIDPSLFFDDDGSVYIMNNDAPEGGSTYDGHRAIWLRKIDPLTLQSVEEATVIMNGGVRPEEKPIWIEGPHIYKRDGWYYFSAAEGGTAINHSQVIARSRNVKGPYIPWQGNPILTQRDMAPDRENPITSVGHASYFEDDEGTWWASFLGVRPYEGDFYNTGRETFLLPVEWRDVWPVILDSGEPVAYVQKRPALPPAPKPKIPTNGNFSYTEEFNEDSLAPYWMFVRVPDEKWYEIKDGEVVINARTQKLGDMQQPSLIARRQQHLYGSASTAVSFEAMSETDEAGLVAFQNDNYYYAVGISTDENGQPIIRLSERTGEKSPKNGNTISIANINITPGQTVYLKASAKGDKYDFYYAVNKGDWQQLGKSLDAKQLSTRTAGGFIGVVFGMYAQTGI